MVHEDKFLNITFPSGVNIKYIEEYMERWQHAFYIPLKKAPMEKT